MENWDMGKAHTIMKLECGGLRGGRGDEGLLLEGL
jgi:hypothetical protein